MTTKVCFRLKRITQCHRHMTSESERRMEAIFYDGESDTACGQYKPVNSDKLFFSTILCASPPPLLPSWTGKRSCKNKKNTQNATAEQKATPQNPTTEQKSARLIRAELRAAIRLSKVKVSILERLTSSPGWCLLGSIHIVIYGALTQPGLMPRA